MLSVEEMEKLGDTIALVRGQIDEGEAGSNEQLRSAQIYSTLSDVAAKVQDQEFKIDEMAANEETQSIKMAEEKKEKKWQHGLKIAEIGLPIAASLAGLCIGLNFEKTNTIVSGLVKTVSNAVLKFRR